MTASTVDTTAPQVAINDIGTEEDLQAAEMRHESGTSSTGEVHEARLKLAEAKLRRAEERSDQDLQRRLLEEIVAIRNQQLEIVQTQHERGTVPATAVREAEAALLEAQARLEAVNSGSSPDGDRPGD